MRWQKLCREGEGLRHQDIDNIGQRPDDPLIFPSQHRTDNRNSERPGQPNPPKKYPKPTPRDVVVMNRVVNEPPEFRAAAGPATKPTVLPMNTAIDPTKAKLDDDHMIFDGADLKREK